MLLFSLLLSACEEEAPAAADDRPTAVCNAAVNYSGGEAFEDATERWGLSDVTGTRLSVADLDQDGFPDLLVTEGSAFGRDDFVAGTRYHRLLMNRHDAQGGRVFVDETVESGLFAPREGDAQVIGRAGSVHVFGDVDNDGDIDVFSGQFYDGSNDADEPGDRSELMLNTGDGTFTMASQGDLFVPAGFATSGASFVDYDADGLLDLWVVGWYREYGAAQAEQDSLFRGRGDGTFNEVTNDAGLKMKAGGATSDWLDGVARRPAFGATTCDLDGDALPDLLASNYGRSWNQQWMNQGNGTFADTSMASGYASDGNLDYTDNQFYACYCSVNACDPKPDKLLISCGDNPAGYWNAGYDDQPARLGGNTFSTACADMDNDGDMDLMSAEIVHWHIGGSADPSELLLNDGTGNFTRPGREEAGLARDWDEADWNEGDLFLGMVDFDADGWKDVLLVTTDYPYDRMFLFRQREENGYEEIAEDAGIAHEWPAGLAIADFDRDGDLDVVTGSSTARGGTPWTTHEVHYYENTLGAGNHSGIRLRGESANRLGIGARVEVVSAGLTQVQEVSGGYGHMGMHHDTRLFFGLGEDCGDLAITVTWPGGAVDTYTGVRPNYEVVLAQGGAVEYGE
jgi:enediyne biosynthesis protein E4